MQRPSAIARDVPVGHPAKRAASLVAAAAVAVLAGACSSGGTSSLEGLLGAPLTQSSDRSAEAVTAAAPQSEIDRAIAHWGEQYKQRPHDLKIALAYARNLKAAGYKQQAFSIVQATSILHGDSKELASEYGRLALEFDQIALAEKLLMAADDPTKPDWKVISARGTVAAKMGQYGDAVPFFERALSYAPNQPSLLNNLAMAHAANGEPAKAEEILRQAAATSTDVKIKQNLALVLGLQGKHDEAKTIAVAAMPSEAAQSDADYIKRMVKATPATQPSAPTPAVATKPAPRAAQGVRVIEAKNTAPAVSGSDAFRPAAGPAAVGSSAGSWATTVSR